MNNEILDSMRSLRSLIEKEREKLEEEWNYGMEKD